MTKQEYTVVSSDKGIELFIIQVNMKLKEGWRCQGGMTVKEGTLLQALIKEIPLQTFTPNA